MKKLVLITILAILSAFKVYSEEFRIEYNKGTDQEYYLMFKIIDDAPGTVEITGSKFYYDIVLNEVAFPSTVLYNDKDYVVTTLSCSMGYISGGIAVGPKKIIIPSTIRWIKNSIGSERLEEVIIDDAPIEELYYIQTFGNNENLRKVSFGNACVFSKLPWGCFQNCHSLTDVQLPQSLKIIEPDAFSGCSSLKSIILPSSVEYMERAFIDCASLEEIKYDGNCMIDLGYESFKNCESLKSISFPSVCNIGESAFLNCKNLTSVTINTQNDSETRIGQHAFDNCVKLETLQYNPASVKEIGEGAFNNCASLKSFSLPSDCEYIGAKAFAGCTGLEKFDVIGDNGSYSDIDGVLIQYDKLLSYPSGKKDTNYSIPEGILSIASGAFEGAVHLTDVSFHDNVTDLGVMAFRDCKALKNVKMPETLNHVPSGTFSGCSSLENVSMPDSYVYIGTSAFQDCGALPEVKLPSELQVIGESAFVNCSKIENVTLPSKVKEIRASTFRNCESLKAIDIPTDLDTIQYAAFQGCKSLERINLPETLKGVEERTFKGCESLHSLIIPDNVESIGINAFEDCASLKEVKVGNGVKEIGQWAFYDCSALEKLTLGSSLESIGAEAFDGDINIKEIICLSPEPPSFPGGFPEEVMENATVTVPAGSEDAYNTDPVWDPMVEGEVQKAERIELNYTEVTLEPKGSITLVATVMPEEAVDRTVTWTSSDYDVANIDDKGVVKAKECGTAIITATASNGVTATCSVKVEIGVTSIILDPSSIEMSVGETVQIEATVLPADATNKTLSWDTSNETVAIVDQNGKVSVIGEGFAVITAYATDGSDIFAECVVNGISSVGSLLMDFGNLDIYSIEGILLRKDADMDYWDSLPKGTYIIRKGGKAYKMKI